MKAIADQIACAEREINKREQVYPRLVASHKMTQGKADHEIECMKAILETLKNFGQQEMDLKP
jgi:hypothetical protein